MAFLPAAGLVMILVGVGSYYATRSLHGMSAFSGANLALGILLVLVGAAAQARRFRGFSGAASRRVALRALAILLSGFTGVVARSGLGFEHLFALYVGQLCYGCAIASIGLACSSFTASQIVAAVLGYAIPFVLLDFAWLTNTVSEEVANRLKEIALLSHYGAFPRGVIELSEVAYYFGIAFLGWLASVTSLELGRAR